MLSKKSKEGEKKKEGHGVETGSENVKTGVLKSRGLKKGWRGIEEQGC